MLVGIDFDCFHEEHYVVDLYNGAPHCLLWGSNLIFEFKSDKFSSVIQTDYLTKFVIHTKYSTSFLRCLLSPLPFLTLHSFIFLLADFNHMYQWSQPGSLQSRTFPVPHPTSNSVSLITDPASASCFSYSSCLEALIFIAAVSQVSALIRIC